MKKFNAMQKKINDYEIKADRIMLLMEQDQNCKLIKKLLEEEFKVINSPDNKIFRDDIDLIIIDDSALKKHKEKILSLRKNNLEKFLPILLVTSKSKFMNFEGIHSFVDELIKTPVGKAIFKNRVKNLLHLRLQFLISEENYHDIAENSPAGICILDNNRIVYANPEVSKILNTSRNKLINENIMKLLDFSNPNKKNEFEKQINKKGKKFFKCGFNLSDGKKWVDIRVSDHIYKGKSCHLLTMSDITERIKNQERIKYLSYHDELTGLYNRRYYEKSLLKMNRRDKLPLTIIIGDMNGLKLVNDAYGHDYGNKIIKEVAQTLKDNVNDNGKIFRLGGDEFAILLPNTEKEMAYQIIDDVRQTLNKSIDIDVHISMALGIAVKRKPDENIEKLLKIAEDRMYRNKIAGSESIRNSILSSLENSLEEKTQETRNHAERMKNLSLDLAKKLKLDKSKIDKLKLVAKFHDIGKVSIPENILNKPGSLTDDEFKLIKQHPESGYRIVKEIPSLAPVSKEILHHHERWDGAGYPHGLKGEDIPFISRIITIIDSFDVMTHKRTYKNAMSVSDALQEIRNCSGSQFDPKLVNMFLKLF